MIEVRPAVMIETEDFVSALTGDVRDVTADEPGHSCDADPHPDPYFPVFMELDLARRRRTFSRFDAFSASNQVRTRCSR